MSKHFPGRRFSWLRLGILIVIAGLVVGGAVWGANWIHDSAEADAEGKPWFAGYVDVTATPTYQFETASGPGTEHVVLAFIVADKDGTCVPSWGSAYTLDEAGRDLDVDRRIARLQSKDRDVVVSFGGLLNDELAVSCDSVDSLAAAYSAVIDRYKLNTIDLDIEGTTLTDAVSGDRRAAAVAQVQKKYRASGRNLAVWLTLPVATSGLTQAGTDTVSRFLNAGVDLAGVNAMTMNFGASLSTGQSMADASIEALQNTHRQLGILYDKAGTNLGARSLWRKLGATPMIGQNDNPSEVFTLNDAAKLNTFAVENGLGRMSQWSLNRDVSCSVNYVDVSKVNDSCSGVAQGDARFATALSQGFTAGPDDAATVTTSSEPTSSASPSTDVDDPSTSPYPVWNEEASYPTGTKVVWRHNVYQAKWWTQGDPPDDPVLQEWETPWRLIGPVLAGETPEAQVTLPAGFYPEWDPKKAYKSGDRVMLDGIAFVARWWNQSVSPESALVDPGGAAWMEIDQDEIRELIAQGKK